MAERGGIRTPEGPCGPLTTSDEVAAFDRSATSPISEGYRKWPLCRFLLIAYYSTNQCRRHISPIISIIVAVVVVLMRAIIFSHIK
jgi:hypothetical protein